MNVNEFVSFIKSKVGCYYWYGTFGQTASKALYNEKKKQYPNYYTASDFPQQIANPKQCFDCAGLVKSPFLYPKYNAAYDKGATGIYGACSVKGKLVHEVQLKNGYLLFRGNDKTKNHVGVFIDGKVYEAKGHAYGVIAKPYNFNDWGYYAEYYAIDYGSAAAHVTTKPSSEQLYIDLAWDCYKGKYGNGLDRKRKINSLGYGNIYDKVQSYVNMIVRGQLKK